MCVFTTAAVVVLYAPMMWWYMVPTFCMIFSISLKLTLSVSLSHSHLAMASMRIIVLSTISQPQNESQRKTHFRAHFIMKIHTRAHTLYTVTWNCVLTRSKSVEKAWIWIFTVIRKMCVEHLANLSLSLSLYLARFCSIHILFDTHGRHWMTLSPKKWQQQQRQQQQHRVQQENMNLCCTLGIRHSTRIRTHFRAHHQLKKK